MRVERDILQQLESWKDSPYRKPLLLKGARQVGNYRKKFLIATNQYLLR